MRRPQAHASRLTRFERQLFRLFLPIILAASSATVIAQTTNVEPVFGIGDNEFLIGGWTPPLPDSAALDNFTHRRDSIHQVISWARDMGIRVFRLHTSFGYHSSGQYAVFDSLLARADTTADIRFFLCGIPFADEPTYGLETRFYLVPDSVPFESWPSRFLHLLGGETVSNAVEEDDWGGQAKEQIYHRDSLSANTVIADSIVIDWRGEQTSWWSQVYQGGQWCRVPVDRQFRAEHQGNSFWSRTKKTPVPRADTTFVVVTGHLIAETAQNDSTVLWIDILEFPG
jgi:hypothetical protein